MATWLAHLLPGAWATDHIGSTSVPGLPAKDCIDLMVRVESLSNMDLRPLAEAGYRERPEDWNRTETLGTTRHPKRVFAPPVGCRSVNIHVRETRTETARYALLFRDFLRANDEHRDTWGRFFFFNDTATTEIYTYGQVKATAQPLLMSLAERWATDTGWQP